jgi:N-methylhydantoinase B
MLRANVRKPEILVGDLQSQLASLEVGARNIERLAAKYGPDTLIQACSALLDQSEAAMRDVIARMPDGVYEFEDFLDDDGISDEQVRLHARITIAGEKMIVDLSGCSPQVPGPINATLASSGSAVYYAVMARLRRPCPTVSRPPITA